MRWIDGGGGLSSVPAWRSLDLGMMDSGRAAIYWPSSSAWSFIATHVGDLYPSAHAGWAGVMYKRVLYGFATLDAVFAFALWFKLRYSRLQLKLREAICGFISYHVVK